MNNGPLSQEQLIGDFLARSGIDVLADIGTNNGWTVRLGEVDETGATVEHVTAAGADYFFSKVEYCQEDTPRASRMIAEILPGNRTEKAYWASSAPTKQLKVHRGRGDIVLCDPKYGCAYSIPFDSQNYSEVTLPGGLLYILRADPESVESLFISGLYDEPIGDWSELETVVQPDDQTITTSEGIIEIPQSFRLI